MPIKSIDPNSGAILFTNTPEENTLEELKLQNDRSEKLLKELDEKIKKLFNLSKEVSE